MSLRKAKTSPKIFISDPADLEKIVVSTLNKVADIVGSTLGPGGKNCLIESDMPGIPNKNTKDGVTVFKSLGSFNSLEHVIIEQARDAAQKTAAEAGDGTTTATILAANMVSNLFSFCRENPKFSPQRVAREIDKFIRDILVPKLREDAIKISFEKNNINILYDVARISANGDSDMAKSVIKAFEILGYGHNAHVTIKEVTGPYGYEVDIIEGYPVNIGYEESMGHFHSVFINDTANQRIILENPKILLFDGKINDLIGLQNITEAVSIAYNQGDEGYKNLLIFAHGFSENVINALAYNFADPGTINVVPINTPRHMFLNSQLHFLKDLSAFTGAKIFGLGTPLGKARLEDLGSNAESFECYRFRSTIISNPNPEEIEKRVNELENQKKTSESKAEIAWLEERLGKLTQGIAKITIFGGSNGELKEAHDRCEDAVCAVRSAIANGAIPGGGRGLLNLASYINNGADIPDHIRKILLPSLLSPVFKLFLNAGYNKEDTADIITQLMEDQNLVYDLENHKFVSLKENTVYDALPAVEQALLNSVSISKVMGTLGGIVVYPRDENFERSEARADSEYIRAVENPHMFKNEANERG